MPRSRHERLNKISKLQKQIVIDSNNKKETASLSVARPKPFKNKTKLGVYISRSNTTQDDVTLRAASNRKPKYKPSLPRMPWDETSKD